MNWVFRALAEGIGLGVIAAPFVFELDVVDLSSLLGIALVLLSGIVALNCVVTAIVSRPKRRAWFELR